jgi:NADPH-dependent curcumin reductase CurA
MNRILITDATGAVGPRVVQILREAGYQFVPYLLIHQIQIYFQMVLRSLSGMLQTPLW